MSPSSRSCHDLERALAAELTLGHNLDSREAVDTAIMKARAAGAHIVRPARHVPRPESRVERVTTLLRTMFNPN